MVKKQKHTGNRSCRTDEINAQRWWAEWDSTSQEAMTKASVWPPREQN